MQKLFLKVREHIIDDACVKSDMLDQANNCDNIQQHSRHAQNLHMLDTKTEQVVSVQRNKSVKLNIKVFYPMIIESNKTIKLISQTNMGHFSAKKMSHFLW